VIDKLATVINFVKGNLFAPELNKKQKVTIETVLFCHLFGSLDGFIYSSKYCVSSGSGEE
jgi:hypothetical protein